MSDDGHDGDDGDDDNDDVEPVREHSALFLLLIVFQAGSRLQSDLRCVHLNLEINLVLGCFIFSVDKLACLTVIWINNERDGDNVYFLMISSVVDKISDMAKPYIFLSFITLSICEIPK